MEMERGRRRDIDDIARRRENRAANTGRPAASRRPGAADRRPVENRRRADAGRYERTSRASREQTSERRYERTSRTGREQTSERRYERTSRTSREQAKTGRYEKSGSVSRLPAENQETADRAKAVRSRRKKKSKRTFLPLLLFIVGLVVLGVLVFALMSLLFGSGEAPHNETRDGVAYLESLEAKDPAAIDETLAAIRKKRMEVERDIIMQKLTDDENDVWSMFHDYVILGDSRAVGFYYYDFLEKNRVLADGGDTIRKIETHMDEIKALNPSYIFLCYGLNDVSIGYWSTPEEYTAEFMQICATLKEEVPGAKIIVSSILPARDPAFDISSRWREIPTYSDMLQDACEENDILFVDNSQTAEDHADLWDIDGIHVRREFYSYWARNLIVAVIEDETYE